MKIAFLLLVSAFLVGCEPFNLDRIDFSDCTKPAATLGVTITKLQAELFVDASTGDTATATWSFGDGRGLPQSGNRVTYLYDRPGTYTVTMTLTNRCNQTFTASRTITVTN